MHRNEWMSENSVKILNAWNKYLCLVVWLILFGSHHFVKSFLFQLYFGCSLAQHYQMWIVCSTVALLFLLSYCSNHQNHSFSSFHHGSFCIVIRIRLSIQCPFRKIHSWSKIQWNDYYMRKSLKHYKLNKTNM